MKIKKNKIILYLDNEELDILLKSIDYFNNASSIFEYGEHVETCQNIHSQIIEHLNEEIVQWKM